MSNRQHRGHKNTTAWRHNPHSKKTDKITSSPNEGVCHHCWEKIEWRKKFRKYKPLTAPGRCNACHMKNVRIAYHTMCQGCATASEICAICGKESMSHPYVVLGSKAQKDEEQDALARMSERQRRTYLRELEREQNKGRTKSGPEDEMDSFSEGDDDDVGPNSAPRPPKFDPDLLVKERAAKLKASGASSDTDSEYEGKRHGVDEESEEDEGGSAESFEEDSEELDRLDQEAGQLVGNKDYQLFAALASAKKRAVEKEDAGSDEEEEEEEEDDDDDPAEEKDE